MRTKDLAIEGGPPVRTSPWPKWPRADARTQEVLLDVLHGKRWTLSGRYDGKASYEQQFAAAFARYNGVAHCTPTTNGSTALVIALKALGVGYGDEVLVPGLTWVACPLAVLECGARPILVDLEPQTLCMSADRAREAITPRTKAMMIVHQYCTLADLDAFVALADQTGVSLLEDCSQAHGATWKGRRVGSFGKVGAFSLHETKVLTAGEGGAAITDDPALHERMQQLRANGRRFRAAPREGYPALEVVGDELGWNGCLSEFQAAVLLDRLGHLDEENATREQNAAYLERRLSSLDGVTTLARHPGVDRATNFRFCIRFDREKFGGMTIEQLRTALSAELDVPIGLTIPLAQNPLYDPSKASGLPVADRQAIAAATRSLPVAQRARDQCLTLPHYVLMGSTRDQDDIVEAISKLRRSTATS
ncbi:MAG: DegT/DnrJ/EryC1/StrS family aminotransferase [Myxococcota bacterium]